MYTMSDYLSSNSKFILVMHKKPDTDCISAVFVFLFFVSISLVDVLLGRRIKFRFVMPGQVYEPTKSEIKEGWMIIHLDTGRRFDPRYGFFDHHFVSKKIGDNEDDGYAWYETDDLVVRASYRDALYMELCPFHSATAAVLDYFMSGTDRDIPQVVIDLVDYTNYVDTGSRIGKKSEKLYSEIEAANSILVDEVGDLGRFFPLYTGPTFLAKSIRQFPSLLDDVNHLKLGLLMIESYIIKYNNDAENEFEPLGEAADLVNPDLSEKTVVELESNLTGEIDNDDQGHLQASFPRLGSKLFIVLPEEPQAVEIIAVKLLHHIRRLPTGSGDIQFAFVSEGEQYTGDVPAGFALIHLGTGGVYDEQQLMFDTSAEGSPYTNVTECIYSLMYHDDNRTPTFIRSLVSYVNFYYSGKTEYQLTEGQYWKIASLHEIVVDAVGENVKFIVNHRAPGHLIDVIDHFPRYLSDNLMLTYGMMFLDGFWEDLTERAQLYSHVEQGEFLTHSGLKFARLPANGFDTKTLRGVVRSKFRDDIDVYVAEFDFDEVEAGGEVKDTSLVPRYTVTIVRDSREVIGMRDLVERIYQSDPDLQRPVGDDEGDVFIHHSDFLIYVSSKTALTLEDLWQMTLETLEMKAEAVDAA